MVKVGDKVRYTGKSKSDLTQGKVYTVSRVYSTGDFAAFDDVGYSNNLISYHYEPITDEPEPVNYAEQAAKYGVVITARVGELSITYDGKK